MAWSTCAALLLLLLGGCNTFDARGSGDIGGPFAVPPGFGRPVPPLVAGSGAGFPFGRSPAGSGGFPAGLGPAGTGGFPGGWQPVDAGLPPAAGSPALDADAGSDDAGR